MNRTKVHIVIATWNSRNFIADALESIFKQAYKDFYITIIDNASSDGTVEFIRSRYPAIYLMQNFKNQGFAKAYNQGIKLSGAEYVLVMHHDVIVDKNFLSRLVAFADLHPDSGALGGKILKVFREPIDPDEKRGDLHSLVLSELIDSAGLEIKRNREVTNRGENLPDAPAFQIAKEVFGVCASVALYRRQALNDVKLFNEFFDEDFYAYKEDIDLSWRLQLAGWKVYYVPEAVAYHHRGFAHDQKQTLRSTSLYRKKISRHIRSLSFINQHLMIIKNDLLSHYLKDCGFIWWREIHILLYALLFERFLLADIGKIIKKTPRALLKRKIIMAHRTASAQALRQWFKA